MARKASSSSSRGTNRESAGRKCGRRTICNNEAHHQNFGPGKWPFFSVSITIFGEVDLDIGRNLSVDTY